MANSTSPLSRRTIAKGMAWTAPVVAIGVGAPHAAATPPPPPVFNFGEGCKSSGGSGKGCIGTKDSKEIPGSFKNTGTQTLVLQFTGFKLGTLTCSGGSEVGVGGVRSSSATPLPGCASNLLNAIAIPAGATVLFLVGSGDAGSSPSTSSSVSWRLLDASCNQLAADCATGSVSNDPCTGCSGCCDPNG